MIFQNRWHMYPQPLMHVRKENEAPGRKESHSKDMVIPSVPEASQVVSGLTFRFIYLGIDLEKDLCSLFHLSLSVVCRLIVFTGE